MKYPFFGQFDASDCGPSCLKMVAAFYGKKVDLNYLKTKTFVDKEGVNLLNIDIAAKDIGFTTLSVEMSYGSLIESAPLPAILFWDKNHFVVLYKISDSVLGKRRFKIADPGVGIVTLDEDSLKNFWCSDKSDKGFCLLLEPGDEFSKETIHPQIKPNIIRFFFGYFKSHKVHFVLILILTIITSIFSYIFPFINKSVVDIGIKNKDIQFIKYVLIFQLFLFLGTTIANVLKLYILLYTSTRININILNDFLLKIMRLPFQFFESKRTGDLIQRMQDNNRIEAFLSHSFVEFFFAIISLLVFSSVLILYDIKIVIVFLVGSISSALWSLVFFKKKRTIDYKRFRELSHNNEEIYEIIRSMPEIKLNSFEEYKSSMWKKIQVKVFKVNLMALRIDQFQTLGADFFTQLKNTLITFFAAYEVVQGHITLGVLLSIAFIIGQLNVPISQIIGFINSLQSLKFSLERINDIHTKAEEEAGFDEKLSIDLLDEKFGDIGDRAITFKNVSYQYGGSKSPWVLKDISVEIPIGKVTAIVGASGSGKTTLLKLLLRFFDPQKGKILFNGLDLMGLSPKAWRGKCAVVMQEGVIFSDTILRNIVMGDDVDSGDEKLLRATKAANIHDFIDGLPSGYTTKIGATGTGLSVGQKQRLFISRALYKDSPVLLFDEATSSLDAENERQITDNMNKIFKNKTVIIIAHRLSTVKNADQIIALEDGAVVEMGSHSDLIKKQGKYFSLIKNQLELGS